MRQNNVVFVFARGEKFRQNILIPDFHSPFFFATAVALLATLLLRKTRAIAKEAKEKHVQQRVIYRQKVVTRSLTPEKSFGKKIRSVSATGSRIQCNSSEKSCFATKNYCIIENIAFHSPATLSFQKEKKNILSKVSFVISSGTDEVRAKRDTSLSNESVNGHFWSNLCLNCIFKWT